jgi:hypothetical protein
MRRRTMLVAGIVIVVIVLAGAFAAISAFGNNNQKPEFLVAQVYINSWNRNANLTDPMDVQFKISLDLNNDGVYEVQQSSQIWNIQNTSIQQAPFHLGGPVASNLGHFNFKVEVFKIVNGAQIPMNYTADGSIPVNQAASTDNSQDSWNYDLTITSNDPLACGISYLYYVS